MPDKNDDAATKKAAEEKAKAEAAAKVKPVRVMVMCEGTLGHLLLKKGETTDDEAYVALLKTPRGRALVQKVS